MRERDIVIGDFCHARELVFFVTGDFHRLGNGYGFNLCRRCRSPENKAHNAAEQHKQGNNAVRLYHSEPVPVDSLSFSHF